MDKFEITVLITFYNQVQYVDDALKSVFEQETSFPFHVIVGDDGSNDGTIERIEEWQKKYPDKISLIIQEREAGVRYNKGMRASRNRIALLKQVDTPYFIYLDGDDYWTDVHKLQIQYDILQDPANDDCVGCAHNIRRFYEKNSEDSIIIPGHLSKPGKYENKRYWIRHYFHTDTILFRSKYIQELPIETIKDSFNDNLITYCFIQFGSLYLIENCMADYRANDRGIWVGEQKAVSMIREFLAYDLELIINPKFIKVCSIRHIRNFDFVIKDHNAFNGIPKEYLGLAQKYHCETSERLLTKKHLFSNSWALDRIKVTYYKLLRKIR